MAFTKGQSGNALGARVKSPEQREFEKQCREWCKEFAFKKLIRKADSEDEKISSWATEALLNRAFGKPVEIAVVDANVTTETGSSPEDIAIELAAFIPGAAITSQRDIRTPEVDGGK